VTNKVHQIHSCHDITPHILEAVCTGLILTDNIQENVETKHNSGKQNKQNNSTLVQSPFTTFGQETRRAYSTTLSPRGEQHNDLLVLVLGYHGGSLTAVQA